MNQRNLRLFSRTVGLVAILVAFLVPLDLWLRIALLIGASTFTALVEVASGRKAA